VAPGTMAAGNFVQGALFTVIVVRAALLHDAAFAREMAQQVARSPRFFRNAPVVLDLRGAEGFTDAAQFDAARQALAEHTLALVGTQNGEPVQVDAAAAAGLASFAPTATQPARRSPPQPAAANVAEPAAPPAVASLRAPARLVSEPVRSGTQIYARGTDLVVTAAVSPGAELVADGNIHVYGALRGRALAGAAGDANARIFCARFEAELVSIAGHYLVSDQFPSELRGAAVQIALDDDRLTVTRI
jgi:septum site-determining protein MinC